MKTEDEIVEDYEELLKKLKLPVCRCGCEDSSWYIRKEEAATLRWVLERPEDEIPLYPTVRKSL